MNVPQAVPKLAITSPLDASFALKVIAIGVVVLAALVFVLSVVVFIHHVITDKQRRRNRERFEAAALMLAPHLVARNGQLLDAVARARQIHGDRAVALVLRRARYDVRGDVTEVITQILTSMNEISKLMQMAKSRRDWKRAQAIRGLGECGGEEARSMLMVSAHDESGEVRRAAREGLLTDGTPVAIKTAIESFLLDLPRRAGWRRSFYARLASVAADELLELISSRRLTAPEEKLALEAIGDAGSRKALPLAVERFTSVDAEMRATAVRVVGKIGTNRELPLLIEALNDIEWYVRAAAARSLEWLILSSDYMHRSAWLSQALGPLGRKLTDHSWWVRANAARALSRAGGEGVRVLLETAEGVDAYARDAALAALSMSTLTPDARLSVRKIISTINGEPLSKPVGPSAQHGGLFA